jgi:hypothetical protein
MKGFLGAGLLVAAGVGVVVLLAGCEGAGSHGMSMASAGAEHPIMCKACYEEVVKFGVGTSKQQLSRNQIIRKHHCPDCKTDLTFYTQDGVPMFKCSKCAPEGVPCDKCEPPKPKS